MEPLIVDSTSRGSAILAYGTAGGPGRNTKLLALIAGSLTLAIVIAIGVWTLRAHIPLPTNRLALAATSARALDTKLNPLLRADLPAPWRAAVETRSFFPAIFGVSMDDDRVLHAFAIVSRTTRVSSVPGLTVETSGPFRILTDGGVTEREAIPVGELTNLLWRGNGHDAALALRMDLLARLAGQTDQTDASTLHGTADGLIAQWDIAPEQVAHPAVSAEIFSIMGPDPASAGLIADGLLHQGVDIRAFSDTPDRIALDPTVGGSLFLFWERGISSKDAALLATLHGSGINRPYVLADATEGRELLPDSSSGTTPGAPFSFYLGENLASSTLLLPPVPAAGNGPCEGSARFSLEGGAFQSVLDAWSVSKSWKERLAGFRIQETDRGVISCVIVR